VFAEAEHNPVPSDAQKSRGTSNGPGAITAPDSAVNTTKAVLILNYAIYINKNFVIVLCVYILYGH